MYSLSVLVTKLPVFLTNYQYFRQTTSIFDKTASTSINYVPLLCRWKPHRQGQLDFLREVNGPKRAPPMVRWTKELDNPFVGGEHEVCLELGTRNGPGRGTKGCSRAQRLIHASLLAKRNLQESVEREHGLRGIPKSGFCRT